MAKSKKQSKNKKDVTNVTNEQKQQGSLNTKNNKEVKEFDTLKMNVAKADNTTHTNKDDDNISASVKSHKFQQEKNIGGQSKDYVSQEASESGGDAFKQRNSGRQSGNQTYTNKSSANPYTRRSEPCRTKFQPYDRKKEGQGRFSLNENVTERRGQNYNSEFNDPRGYKRRPRDDFENPEFFKYEKEFRQNKEIEYVKTIEIEHDLFLMPKEYSLAHCVAEDMNMGSGIAVQFRRDFKKVDQLLNQRQKTGGLAVLQDYDRYIYYLVTKRYSSGKPTYATLFASLQKLKQHIIENRVAKLAMPRIGCGLDRLEWENVKYMIEFVFRDVDVEIRICNLQPIEGSPQIRHKNCRVTNVDYPIQRIEEGTIIVYLSSEDGEISEEMNLLNEKFNFLNEFRYSRKSKGRVVYFNRNENYLLCGCIVKRIETDPIDFESFQTCIYDIQKTNKKYSFYYIGFQAIRDEDTIVNYKIMNILRNAMRDVEVYICWPGDLQHMIVKDRFSDYNPKTSAEKYTPDRKDTTDNWRNNSSSTQNRNRVETGGTQWTWGDRNKNLSYEQASTSQHNTETYEQYSFQDDHTNNARGRKSEENTYEANVQTDEMQTDWFENSGGNKTLPSEIIPDRAGNTFVPTESWDDDWEDQSLISKEDEGSSSQTNVKSEEDACQSSVEINEQESLEDSPPRNSKKLKKSLNKDLPKNEENWSESVNQTTHLETDEQNENQNAVKYTEKQNMSKREYEMYEIEKIGITQFSAVKEGQVNDLPGRYSRACYVTEDLNVERSGVPFGSNINNYLGELLQQKQKEGGLAVLEDDSDYLYCLVIKQSPSSAPTSSMVFSSIQKMRDHAMSSRVKKIVIPQMVKCSKDTFNWSEVKCMLEYLFQKRNIDIFLAPFQQVKQKNKLTHVKSALHQMKPSSIIIYLASEDGYVSEEILSLDKRFKLVAIFKNSKKYLGDVIQYKPDENYVLYGCVVKKVQTDSVDFVALQQCILKINESNNKAEKFSNVGIQAVNDNDEAINLKIITVLINTLQDATISMCWPLNLRDKMPSRKT